MRRLTVALPDDEYARFRVAAARVDAPMGAIGRRLIIDWVDTQRAPKEAGPPTPKTHPELFDSGHPQAPAGKSALEYQVKDCPRRNAHNSLRVCPLCGAKEA